MPETETHIVEIPNLSTALPKTELPPAPAEPMDALPPRRRGRAKKARQPEPMPPVTSDQPIVISADEQKAINHSFALGWRVVFAVIASSRGKHWELDDDTANALGESWGIALAPWIAKGARYVPIATAVLATAGVVMPRLSEDSARLVSERDIIPLNKEKLQ